jgi:hypothetical protein
VWDKDATLRLTTNVKLAQSDPDKLPVLVQRLNAQYQIQCSACGTATGRVQPEVIMAR